MMETDDKNDVNVHPFEKIREKILDQALLLAVFEGFNSKMLEEAAQSAGVSEADLKAVFPDGIPDLIGFWTQKANLVCLDRARFEDFAALKVREKVAVLVLARLEYLRPHKESARRAAAYLALPFRHSLGARLAWSASDSIWRALHDKSTDFNFYSKRAILTGVWTSTLARWFADDGDDEIETKRFLEARIENVMQIEKAKAKVRNLEIDPAKPIEWLSRLRYPSR